jgi:methylmalonyl-CoA epimerase
MEIADIFVVNKADRDGADRTAASIETMLSLEDWPSGEWRPPVVRTEATSGRGVTDLIATIAKFRDETATTMGERRRARTEWRLRELLGRQFIQHLERHVLAPGEFATVLERVANRDTDPYSAAAAIVRRGVSEGPSGATAPAAATPPLDHVGIAVPESETLVKWFEDLFGIQTSEHEDIGLHRLRFVATGDATLELVEPLSPEAPVAKFLAKRGMGLHHICLRVSDIEASMAALKAKGVTFIDEKPRQGAHGSRIAFLHPSSAHGLLVELKELAHG